MDLEHSVFTYDILGYKVKLSSEDSESSVSADDVVNMVKDQVDQIKSQCPHLDSGEVAVLAALAIAKERIAISNEYRDNIADLSEKADAALGLIENISPTTV